MTLRLLGGDGRPLPGVRVEPPVAPDALVAALAPYDIGLVIDRLDTDNTRLALPNKLFEYLMAGLAVAVPRAPAMAELVEAHGSRRRLRARTARRCAAAARGGPGGARRDAAPCARARRLALQRRGPAPDAAPRLGTLMCGICGIVALQRPPETERRPRDARRAAAPRARRRGLSSRRPGVALGHARLAIIDLSDGGRQPFASDDGALQLLHNGEVFNYLELRAELEQLGHRFRTRDGHRGRAARVRAVGAVVRRALQRHVGHRALGRPSPAALLLPRPLRDQAVRLPRPRRPARLRERAAGAPPRPILSRASKSRSDPRLPRAGSHRSSRGDVLRRRASAPAGTLAHVRRGRAAPRCATGRSSRATRRQTRSERSGSSSSTRSACVSAATCRSAPPSPAGSIRLPWRSRSTTCCGRRRSMRGRSASGSGRSPSTSRTPASTSAPSRRRSWGRSSPSPGGSHSTNRRCSTYCRTSSPLRGSRSGRRAWSRSGS